MKRIFGKRILLAAVCVAMLMVSPAFVMAADGETEAPGLNVSKDASVTEAAAGDVVTYTVKAWIPETAGDAVADTVMKDVLPAGLEYVSGSVSSSSSELDADFSYSNGTLSVEIYEDVPGYGRVDGINPGQSITITYQAKIADSASAGDQITNTAQVSGTMVDTVSDSATVTVTGGDDEGGGDGDSDGDKDDGGELDHSPKCGDSFFLWELMRLFK